jgi:hypothetical protein
MRSKDGFSSASVARLITVDCTPQVRHGNFSNAQSDHSLWRVAQFQLSGFLACHRAEVPVGQGHGRFLKIAR